MMTPKLPLVYWRLFWRNTRLLLVSIGFLWVFIPASLKAQPGWLGDTCQVSKLVFIGGLDNRQTFLRNRPVEIFGYFAGIRLHGKHALGLGYYHLPLDNKNSFLRRFNTGTSGAVLKDFDVRFFSLFYAFTIQNNRYFRVQFPIEAGFGEIESSKPSPGSESGRLREFGNMGHVHLGADFSIKLCRWGGLNATFGYRKVFKSELFQGQLDGIYYSYGLSIYFDAFWIDGLRLWRRISAPESSFHWKEMELTPPED